MAAGTYGLLGMQLAMTPATAKIDRCDGCKRRYARTGRQPRAWGPRSS